MRAGGLSTLAGFSYIGVWHSFLYIGNVGLHSRAWIFLSFALFLGHIAAEFAHCASDPIYAAFTHESINTNDPVIAGSFYIRLGIQVLLVRLSLLFFSATSWEYKTSFQSPTNADPSHLLL
jgi:hypothetical protein